MKECMPIDKKVSVLLATYNPNVKWLKELLHSLAAQTYPNLEIVARDDCSPNMPMDMLTQIFEECLQGIKWSLKRNERNMGSNLTFEALTTEANGAYFAYCDQDDIWFPYKIEKLVHLIEKTNSVLVCSDMEIIDENGKKTAASITEIRKRHVFRRGSDLAEGLLQNNFVTGCAMLISSEIAKAAVPFEEGLYHDHWLALYASTIGNIEYTEKPLIQYRIHSSNQTGVLVDVNCKEDYYKIRIEQPYFRYKHLRNRFQNQQFIVKKTEELQCWMQARKMYYRYPNFKNLKQLKSGYKFGKHIVLLETVLPFMPEFLFRIIVKLAVKGIL